MCLSNREIKRRSLRTAVMFGVLTVGSIDAFATAIPIIDSGILTIGNTTGVLVGITSVPFCINWGGGSACAGASHPVSISGLSADFFPGSAGTIKDVSAVPVVDFLDVSGLFGTIHFDLISLPVNPGVDVGICTSNAPLNTCTPALSPFTLSQDVTGTQVTIAFAALMNAYTGASTSGSTPYKARFSTNLSGTISGTGACSGLAANITNVLTCMGAGGTIQATWSATASPSGDGGGPLTITTNSVANGKVGSPYFQVLTATGGKTPYAWSIVSGRLPAGLTLNSSTGQITGTPLIPGTSNVSFQVTDSSVPPTTATVGLVFTVN